MILDIIGIIIVLMMFLRGYQKGVIIAVFSLLSIFIGIIVAMRMSGWFLDILLSHDYINGGWAPLLSFLILFNVVVLIVRWIAKMLSSVAKALFFGWADRILGGVLYLFIGITFWSTLLWLADKAHVLSPGTIVESRTYSFFAPIAPYVFDHIGIVVPFAKNLFSDMKNLFYHIDISLPTHVGAH